jgi:hypothetical protein
VRRRDRDAARLLLRRLVDLVERRELRQALAASASVTFVIAAVSVVLPWST